MKIVQLNVWCGRVINSTLKFLEEQSADIVCAQEVIHAPGDIPNLFDMYKVHDSISQLYPYQYFSPTFDFEFYGAKVFFGNAIYSKYPFSKQKTEFTHGEYAKERSVKNPYESNRRNVQTVELLIRNKGLTIVNHHGYHIFNQKGDNNSIASMKKVANMLSKIDSSLIFCGDLNVSPDSPAAKIINSLKLRNHTKEHKIETTLSSLSRVPVDVPCDYIFTSPQINVSNFIVSEEIVSDHKALILEFDV